MSGHSEGDWVVGDRVQLACSDTEHFRGTTGWNGLKGTIVRSDHPFSNGLAVHLDPRQARPDGRDDLLHDWPTSRLSLSTVRVDVTSLEELAAGVVGGFNGSYSSAQKPQQHSTLHTVARHLEAAVTPLRRANFLIANVAEDSPTRPIADELAPEIEALKIALATVLESIENRGVTP